MLVMLQAASGVYGSPCPKCGTRVTVPYLYRARSAAPLLFFAISMTVGYPNTETAFEFLIFAMFLSLYLLVTSKLAVIKD